MFRERFRAKVGDLAVELMDFLAYVSTTIVLFAISSDVNFIIRAFFGCYTFYKPRIGYEM